jgi:proton translocating ATP synthase F1 alpha subunit
MDMFTKPSDLLGRKHKANVSSIGDVGIVLNVKDGIVEISGLANAKAGELVKFSVKVEKDVYGLVLNLNKFSVNAVLLDYDFLVDVDTIVSRTNKLINIPVGWGCLGRVLNGLGEPVDGLGNISNTFCFSEIERKAPGINFRHPVNEPVRTGLTVVDALIPVGRGQRELIIGDRQTGKTTICVDTILNQSRTFNLYPKSVKSFKESDKNKNICIYVGIGQKRSSIAKLVNLLKRKNAMEYTTVFAATASEPAALQYIIPYSGNTLAEFFVRFGLNVIIFFDDLSKHANAYRQISLLLRRPPGREAYPGDIFYLHSRLLERAFKLSDRFGGGSITALPIIETQAGDVSAYIPTNVISITDGQIFLESELFYKGIRPAVNPGLSVSRVGSAAQDLIMKKIAGSLKLELAQYREILAFSKFGSSLDENTMHLLNRGELLTDILKQPQNKPLSLPFQVALLYPILKGFFRSLKYGVSDYMKKFSLFFPFCLPNRVRIAKTNPNLFVKSIDCLLAWALTFDLNSIIEDSIASYYLANFTSVMSVSSSEERRIVVKRIIRYVKNNPNFVVIKVRER